MQKEHPVSGSQKGMARGGAARTPTGGLEAGQE